MAVHALKAGYMLGDYRIERLLGEGGFGLTYLAFDTNLEKIVAIKEYMPSEHAVREIDSRIIAKSKSSEKVYQWGLNAFLNEAKTLAKFEHPNIVRIFHLFKANGTAYIVMEYCEGGCLIDRISKDVHMPEEQLKDLFSSLVHGLQLVHNDGILHRDIKPDNIMFRLDGTPVLIDFGAARQAIGNKSRKVTTIITPGYAPLEQYSSNGVIGPWSDIYSLSAVAYLCLTGKRPPDIMNRLHEDTIQKLSQSTNASAFIKSIDKGLELQINDRPQSLSEWSSGWLENELNLTKNSNSIKKDSNHIPIYASKDHPIGNKPIGGPISARTSIDTNSQTIVNTKSIELDSQKKNGFLRFLSKLLVLGIIGAGGYFGYDYYLNQLSHDSNQEYQQQLVEEKAAKQPAIEKPMVKEPEIQQSNIANQDSQSSLIQPKETLINPKDESDWKIALSEHSIEGYQNYQIQHPYGAYVDQVPILIAEIVSVEKKKLELQELMIKESNAVAEQKSLDFVEEQKSNLIKNIQFNLQQLKFKDIITSGEIDNKTKKSIIAYQKLKNLEPDGFPSRTLLYLLKAEQKWPGRLAGESFTDCENCPTMIVIGAGNYMMGSDKGEDNEKPPHYVSLNEFAISETEVTFAQWKQCLNDNVCTNNPADTDLYDDEQAVIRVNRNDVDEYLLWINKLSSKNYRLPSEAEWEYAARAGTTTAYSWGDDVGINNVICVGCQAEIDINTLNKVKNFPANSYGLYDMHGNVWEWTADCWHNNYLGAPSDNLPWEPNDCNQFVVRGGSGGNTPDELRSTSRGAMKSEQRLNSLGFRIAIDTE